VKILVIGDAMADHYWHGVASRLSPEAPVPIVSVNRTETRPGGAANVAANIEAMGVPCERIFGTGERIKKIRLMAGQHVVRIDFDPPQTPILPDAAFTEAVGRCDLVVAVDYGKGSLSGIAALILAASGIPVLVDPKGHDWERYRGAALIKPNKDEMPGEAIQLMAAYGIGAILHTQAADGMTLYTPTATLHQASENHAPVDVSGAGEAALAAFAAGLAKGLSRPTCLRLASKAAGIAISRQGTTVCTEEEVFGPR